MVTGRGGLTGLVIPIVTSPAVAPTNCLWC